MGRLKGFTNYNEQKLVSSFYKRSFILLLTNLLQAFFCIHFFLIKVEDSLLSCLENIGKDRIETNHLSCL